MNAMYDPALAMVTIVSPTNPETLDVSARPIGQGTLWGEVSFWLSLGYIAEYAAWDGQRFVKHQTFTQADL